MGLTTTEVRVVLVVDTERHVQRVELGEELRFLPFAQSEVGGLIQAVHLPGPNIDLWVHEEGKLGGFDVNEWATAAAFWGKAGLSPFDNIHGPVVATGIDQSTGETLGLTDEQERWLRGVVI